MEARGDGMLEIVRVSYREHAISLTEDGWFNATQAAERFGKTPYEWFRLPSTIEYLAAIGRKYGKIPYFKTRSGKNGGTWMRPDRKVELEKFVEDQRLQLIESRGTLH